jgi:hypothetical protein
MKDDIMSNSNLTIITFGDNPVASLMDEYQFNIAKQRNALRRADKALALGSSPGEDALDDNHREDETCLVFHEGRYLVVDVKKTDELNSWFCLERFILSTQLQPKV